MSATPRASRTPSRASSHSRSSYPVPPPTRLVVPPPLRQQPSLSGLQVFSSDSRSHAPSPSPGYSPDNHVASSSSSVIDVDATEGILLKDTDAEVEVAEGEDATADGRSSSSARDEVSKRVLREQLKQTLVHSALSPDVRSPGWSQRKSMEMAEIPLSSAVTYPSREYFVLTDAGKPVFISRPERENAPDLTSTIGIMQALISVFLDDGDRIRSINAGKTKITFLLRSPLYYACVSSWGEPESISRSHLEYLHLQILSIVSVAQLRRIFERRGNFDLRRLLHGAENLLHTMLARLESDFSMTSSSLHCLRLESSLRARAAECLFPASQTKSKVKQDILYVILVANGRVVTLARPRKHSIHPSDLHILLNTIHSPSVLNSAAAATWLPVCLPKYNPSGFVNAYINFMSDATPPAPSRAEAAGTSSPSEEATAEDVQRPQSPSEEEDPETPVDTRAKEQTRQPGIALVCVSAGGDFEAIREWGDAVVKKLTLDGVANTILLAIASGFAEYSVAQLGIPGLRHFVYKSRSHVQVTLPQFEDPYDDVSERRRLVTLYQILNDSIHAKSGQEGSLKLQYIRTDKESVMGWITQPFELYVAVSPLLPKSAVVNAANSVARWVKKEEGRLFLRDAPVF